MRKFWGIATGIVLVLLLCCAGEQAPVLATNTATSTPTANFVLPLINVPIVLPTAFMPPLPTAITVNVTVAPNMNPLGLQVPGNPIWAWNEGLNWMQGIFKAMGWIGNLIYFCFIVVMALALMQKIRRALMGEAPTEKPVTRIPRGHK
jgi:hypothetical protein